MKEKKNKKKVVETPTPACPIMGRKNENDLFMNSPENWNTQDNRTFIMNADFRQMDSAKDKS
ncbi:hypothetical protein [Maridesulfovibrio sp. FT414]|uniref:hypothetical protein n=1 Tax=Maridesulfovibrio sp. FT414 TaxID=2979469 RepID=UPI003D809515